MIFKAPVQQTTNNQTNQQKKQISCHSVQISNPTERSTVSKTQQLPVINR
jgi:hypothetical protein